MSSEQGIGVPHGAGRDPDLVNGAAGTGTLPATTLCVLRWNDVCQKLRIANNTGGSIYVNLDQEVCDPANGDYEEEIPAGKALVLGLSRPHRFQLVAVYAAAEVNYAGTSRNASIRAWAS